MFFDVVVPSFETTWTWSLRTLDQNDLGLDSALRTLQSHIKTAGDPNLEQALKRVELQVNPAVLARSSAARHAPARATRPARLRRPPIEKRAPADDPILTDPERGVPHRSDAGAEGRDARSQQLARHRRRTSG